MKNQLVFGVLTLIVFSANSFPFSSEIITNNVVKTDKYSKTRDSAVATFSIEEISFDTKKELRNDEFQENDYEAIEEFKKGGSSAARPRPPVVFPGHRPGGSRNGSSSNLIALSVLKLLLIVTVIQRHF